MSSEKPSPLSSNPSDVSLSSGNEISQEELINSIESTIAKLNSIVTKINDEKIKNLPKKESLTALLDSTEMIASSFDAQETESPTEELKEETIDNEDNEEIDSLENWEDDLSSIEATETEPIEEPVSKIEGVNLPDQQDSESSTSVPKKLSGATIIGIIGLVLVAVLSTSYFIFKPSLPDLAIFNSSSEIPQPELVETPPQLEVPQLPEPIRNVPSPQPKLTPEQSLIAAIQKEVTNLTNQYPDDLIGRIEANFIGSRLIVTVSNQWYNLSNQEQDNLANNILERSWSLDFRKLEMLDSQRNLIARSPVVGDEVIILKRIPSKVLR